MFSSFSSCSCEGDHFFCNSLLNTSGGKTSFDHHSPQLVKNMRSESSGKSLLVNAARILAAPVHLR